MLKSSFKKLLSIFLVITMVATAYAGSILVLPEHKVEAVGTDDFFGMFCGNDTDVAKAIPHLNDLNVKWIRLWTDAHWATDPSSGTEPGAFQKARDLKAAGFKIIMEFNHHDGANQAIPSYSTAKAYFDWAKGKLGSTVDIYEIGNELNVYGAGKYWPSDSDADIKAYVDNVLKAAWDSLHPSGHKVLGAPLTPYQRGSYGTTITQKLVDYGYLNYCDYAGTHSYTETAKEMHDHLEAVKKIYGSKPLIATEWNYKSASSEDSYASKLNQIYEYAKGTLKIACYYRFITSSWPGVVNSSNGVYSKNDPIYSTYYNWSHRTPTSVSGTIISPSADAYVYDKNTTTNYGSSESLVVQGGSGYTRYTYMKLDLSSVTSATSAKLRLFGSYGGTTNTVECYPVSDSSWVESSITWSNKPAVGTSMLSSVTADKTYKYYELDLTNYVKSNYGKTISIALKTSSNETFGNMFHSRESGSFKPQLVVQGNTAPVQTTLNPTADTYVNSASATTSYGTNNILETYNNGSDKVAYLKFDLSDYSGSSVSSATLTLTKYFSDSGMTVGAFSVSDGTWTEGITWNTKPSMSSSSSATSTVGSTATLNITSIVNSALQGDKTLSIAVKITGGTGRAAFYSNNLSTASSRPKLTLNP